MILALLTTSTPGGADRGPRKRRAIVLRNGRRRWQAGVGQHSRGQRHSQRKSVDARIHAKRHDARDLQMREEPFSR